jgi:hypothetical protein
MLVTLQSDNMAAPSPLARFLHLLQLEARIYTPLALSPSQLFFQVAKHQAVDRFDNTAAALLFP